MDVFVREAIARAGFERQEAVAAAAAEGEEGADAGFLEVSWGFWVRNKVGGGFNESGSPAHRLISWG
jgi:hypothetical protein